MTLKRTKYTDSTPMPWGGYEGTPLGEVDTHYLLWLLRQPWIKDRPNMYAYLIENQEKWLSEEVADETEDSGGFQSYDDYMKYGRG